MATFDSMLIQRLSTSRRTIRMGKVSYSCSNLSKLFKRNRFASLHIPSGFLPIALPYSQKRSVPFIGHMRKPAALGFKTGGDSYDARRPGYTYESVDLIVSEIVATSEAAKTRGLKYDVLELASGTGKLTESLSMKLPRHMKYLATEPSENFLKILKSKVLNVDVAMATADSIPLVDNAVGSVVCAHSFHWFSGMENLKSIHNVLIPGGKLILIWNMKQFGHGWMSAFYEQRQEVVKRNGGSLNDLFNTMQWRKDIDASEDFKLLWHKSLAGVKFQGDIETVLSHLTAVSYNLLPAVERDAYAHQLRQILINWPGLDLNNITVPYTTELYVFIAQ